MSIGAVAYNPYNTSFATFAMQGLQMAQENMRASEALALQTSRQITESFANASRIMQQVQDNKARQREADRADRADAFKEMAFGMEFDFKRDRAATQDSQWEKSFGLQTRAADQADRGMDLSERNADFNEKKYADDQQWRALEFGERITERNLERTSPRSQLDQAQATSIHLENARMARLMQLDPDAAMYSATGRTSSKAASETSYDGMVDYLKQDVGDLQGRMQALDSILGRAGAPMEATENIKQQEGGRSPIAPSNPRNRPETAGSATPAQKSKDMSETAGGMFPEGPPKDYTETRKFRDEVAIDLAQKQRALMMLLDPATDRTTSEFKSAIKVITDQMKGASDRAKTTSDPRDTD